MPWDRAQHSVCLPGEEPADPTEVLQIPAYLR